MPGPASWIVRPAAPGDVADLLRLAGQSPVGVTSLPRDAAAMERRIAESCQALEDSVAEPGAQSYLFVLEADGRVAGTCGVDALAGAFEPLYSYRQETLVHASRELDLRHEVAVLSLCHDLSGASLLGGFAIEPALLDTEAATLLSRARLLFMAAQPQRFAALVAAELLGPCDAAGNAPFWDAVGRHFFGISYALAQEHCRNKGRAFIAELLPQHPVYVPLLSGPAQAAIGALHPHSERPAEILRAEGLAFERYVDIFDGGPALQAPWSEVRTLAGHRHANLIAHGVVSDASPYLIGNGRCRDFRCVLAAAEADAERGELWVADPVITALQAGSGDPVFFIEA